MKQYINREALLELLKDEERYGYLCMHDVMSIPAADVVEVVRCKDCKWFIPDNDLDHEEYPNGVWADGLCSNILKFSDVNDYCSYGKRKE